MLLSHHFSLDQLCRSETATREGIDNRPPAAIISNLRRLAVGLDQVCDLLGAPLEISSGYRSAALNARVGGSLGSQHTLGLAADFVCPGFGSPMDVARAIVLSAIDFDQVILEYGRWVHLSFCASPRRRALTIDDTSIGYREGLWLPGGPRLA